MKHNAIRTRWSAIGAAVAITLGAGGIGLVSATSPADAVAYVPIEPCRIADTRPEPAFSVGPRSTPIGTDETVAIAAHGDNGECTGIPTSATGLQLNVTALNPTQNTFVTVWGEGTRPNASSVNPATGQPPAPNAVTTGLSGTGTFNVYNRFGTVDVIVDVVGFYTDHNHDDRYYTEDEVDTAISGFQPPNPFALDNEPIAITTTGTTFQTVLVTSITVPEGYTAVLKAEFTAESSCTGGGFCVINILADGTEMDPAVGPNYVFDAVDGGSFEGNAVMRTLTVAAGSYNIRVRAGGSLGATTFRVDDSSLFVEAFLQPA